MPTIATYDAAEATKWQEEFIMDYAIHDAPLPKMCMQQGWMPGNGTVTFDIVQDDAEATTRDRNGNIVYGLTNQATTSVTLEEALGAEKITNFSAFKSAVDQRKIMYMRTQGAMNRELNAKVITQLAAGTKQYNSGTAVALTEANLFKIIQAFWENTRGAGGEAGCVLSIAAYLQLKRIAKVSSKDYVDGLKFQNGMMAFQWENITWAPFDGLTGRTTASASCYLFKKNAVAFKSAGETSFHVGYNEENRYYYCNAQDMVGCKLLLDNGVYEFNHDDTAAYS